MKHVYQCIESIFHERDRGEYVTYGIKITDKQNNALRVVEDISIDKKKIQKLVNLCNRLKVDIEQIDDIIEDFLVDLEI